MISFGGASYTSVCASYNGTRESFLRIIEHAKFKLVIAYDGTAYEGWQVQKIGTGVQQIVETALAKLFPSAPRLHSSSRTDTGVHALGMVAHFEIPARRNQNVRAQARAWRSMPGCRQDIRVLSAARATEKFHARFDAAGKQYRYFVWNHRGDESAAPPDRLARDASAQFEGHARRRAIVYRTA